MNPALKVPCCPFDSTAAYRMRSFFVLLAVALFSDAAGALKLPAGSRAVGCANMKMPSASDLPATPVKVRSEEPCAFFGGEKNQGLPEGTMCAIRKGAVCNRKRCQVNKAPCKDNH